MDETRTGRPASLREQLARHEATGELLPDAQMIEVVTRVDRYLQAVALAKRTGPGGKYSLGGEGSLAV
jgi:hypothetical protein